MKSNETATVSAYVLCVLLVSALVVFWKFPYQSLQRRLEAAARAHLGLSLDMTDLSPSLPPGVEFSRCVVSSGVAGGPPFFESAEGEVRFRVLPLFLGRLALDIHASAYGGSLDADITLKPFYAVNSYKLTTEFQAMRIERHPAIVASVGRELSGGLSGEVQLEGDIKKLARSVGKGELTLDGGSCPIDFPYLRLKKIDGLEAKAVLTLEGGELQLSECQFHAKGVRGTLKGVMVLGSLLSESTLDLKGQGHIDASLINIPASAGKGQSPLFDKDKPIPFRIRGTIAKPSLTLF